jgi:hypothetical protein
MSFLQSNGYNSVGIICGFTVILLLIFVYGLSFKKRLMPLYSISTALAAIYLFRIIDTPNL